MKRYCKWCQHELINKRADALFCNKKCKKKHWDRQKYPIPAKRLTPNERKLMRYKSKLNWQANNREHHLQIRREWSKKEYETNPNYKLGVNLRNRLYSALKDNLKVGSAVDDLGCSISKLKIYLQLQFRRNPRNNLEQMTWDNHSKAGWHIDHIIPLASAKTSQELIKLCHYTNLQPLWWWENLKKADSTD